MSSPATHPTGDRPMNRFTAPASGAPAGTPALPRRSRAAAVLGALLVPLLAAAVLVGALWNPQDRLDQVTAAIVNEDVPVEVDGQLVPLGRQLSAALVGGGSDGATDGASDGASGDGEGDTPTAGYTWVLTDAADAREGLRTGGYTAVVTIPADFSAAATSASDPARARQATIDVTTSARNRLVDDAVTQAIAATTVDVLGSRLTTAFLDSVLVGFTTLGEELGAAADGAAELADGAAQLADGTSRLADGQRSLADGAAGLADGTAELADGTQELASGTAALSDGAARLAGGARQLADGTGPLADGAGQLAGGLAALRTGTADLPAQATALVGGLRASADGAAALSGLWSGHATDLQAAADAACAEGSAACTDLQGLAGAAAAYAAETAGLAGGIDTLATGTAPLADEQEGLPALAGGIARLAGVAEQLAGGAARVDGGASGLATGAADLAAGVRSLAGGTAELDGGVGELSTGAAQLAAGAQRSADGAGELAGGAAQVGDGTAELADGLGLAVEEIPAYTEGERRSLADVVAEPVATADQAEIGFGRGALALFTVLALWLGALGLFAALPAVPADALGTTRSAARQALRAFALPAAVGVGQGLVVTAVVAGTGELSAGGLAQLGLLAALLGVVFAAVNQALVAWLGGAGRLVALVVALVVLAAGVVTATPAWLTGLEGALPVGPAVVAVQAVVQDAAGGGGAVTALSAWGAGALVATALAVGRRRTVRVPARRGALALAA